MKYSHFPGSVLVYSVDLVVVIWLGGGQRVVRQHQRTLADGVKLHPEETGGGICLI